MSEIEANDYVTFTRMIKPAVRQRVRSTTGEKFDYEVSPAELVECSGSGLVRRVAKNKKKFGAETYQTGRVATANGVVTAILDDAVIIGTQTRMDLGCEAVASVPSMYDTQGDGA